MTDFKLMELPYKNNALEPYISSETISYHHGKHHQAYVNNLNKLIKGTDFENKTLEEIIKKAKESSETGIFNNSAQIWNHDFYWHSLTPNGTNINDHEEIKNAIDQSFESFESFRKEFTEKATKAFGSAWAWLVYNKKGLEIVITNNADTPILNTDTTPLLTLDLWEHGYYIDYRNRRPDYIKDFFDNLINWGFANNNLKKS